MKTEHDWSRADAMTEEEIHAAAPSASAHSNFLNSSSVSPVC